MYVTEDRQPPVISVPSGEIVYEEGDSYDILLAGVSARDNRDGDVSSTVRIENILPSVDGQAMVVYMAKDSRNNIAEVSRVVQYLTADQAAGGTRMPAETGTEESAETAAAAETEAAVSVSEEEEVWPKITLTDTEVTLKRNSKFNALTYVDYVDDDKDDAAGLARRIQVSGDAVNIKKAGIYDVVYRVTDSEGNHSEPVVLQVVVE